MAQYFTNFSEYTTGVQPTDWTKRFHATFDWLVEDDAGATGGKKLVCQEATASDRNGLSWDAIDGDVNRADGTTYARIRFPTVSLNDEILMMIRGVGSDTNETAIRSGPRPKNSQIEIAKYVNANFSSIATYTLSFTENVWYDVEAQSVGTSQKLKFWLASDPKPTAWQIETTTSTPTAAGWVGLFRFDTGLVEIDRFGFGSGTDAAPTSPVTPTLNAPINLGFTNKLTTAIRLTWEQG